MPNWFFSLIISIFTALSVTAAQPKTSSQNQVKDRRPIFIQTLAYMPSILVSAITEGDFDSVEKSVANAILSAATQNVNFNSQQEYIFPKNYLIFNVVMSTHDSDFILDKNEKPRTAYTTPEPKSPIVVNQNTINNSQIEITVPDAVQTLFHEIGRKIPQIPQPLLDRTSAKLRKYLNQNYMTLDLSGGRTLHVLNIPFNQDLPQLDETHTEQSKEAQIFRAHYVRYGREILIFHEDEKEFLYVPTLKPLLMGDGGILKKIATDDFLLSTITNIEQIRVDQGISKFPLVRFRLRFKERAYRSLRETKKNEKGEDVKVGPQKLQSLSTHIDSKYRAAKQDETSDYLIEAAVRFQPDGNIDISRREALESDPVIEAKNLSWTEYGDSIMGRITLEVPKDEMNRILNYDLRAFMLARMDDGLVRVEVNRVEFEENKAHLEFKIPSKQKTNQSYLIQEIVIRNKKFEAVVDLPETITVKKKNAAKNDLQLIKWQFKQGEQFTDLKLKEKLPSEDVNLSDLENAEGITKVDSGTQTFRLTFKSDVPLTEIYFYFRSMYMTHDPRVRVQVEEQMGKLGLLGEAILKQQSKELFSRTVSYIHLQDEVLHIPASKLRQVQKGPYLIVDVEIPMEVMRDKGPNTFDTGLRYIGKAIAINQRMERWKRMDLREPMFSVNGTNGGMKSCRSFFEDKESK